MKTKKMTPQPKPSGNGRKKTATAIISFILDETGSMMDVRDTAIKSFNEFIESMVSTKTKANMTLTKFNSTIGAQIVYTDVPVEKVERLTEKTYMPNSMTPLYDAIGKTLRELESKAVKGQKVMVIILTDGLNNASKEFTKEGIASMIKDRIADGWEFSYLGANQDAWVVSEGLGIPMVMAATIQPTARGIGAVGRTVCASTQAYLSGQPTLDRQRAYNMAYQDTDDQGKEKKKGGKKQ